ncbi:long-chain fatty acid--CoA ligase [Nocardia sp. NPDC050718]|uniref:long-chain-fatty-acid--CoA ligase n=1 Tax=Nocardia sp. NPDC050718 TaxID=3155788 RepID=UPI0033D242F3
MLNLAVLLEDAARNHPDREALVVGDARFTYAEIDAAANQVAGLLVERGIRTGDKVALSCPNTPWFPIVYYGILKAGGVVVPLNVLLKAREIGYHLRDSDAVAYFCAQGTIDLPMATEGRAGFDEADGCRHLFVITDDPSAPSPLPGIETLAQALLGRSTTFESAATESTDSAVVLYTSGTTGQPKGAELTHANLVLNAMTSQRLVSAPDGAEVHLVALPLFHAFGQTLQLHTAFASAATVVLMPRFAPHEALRLMRDESVTHFAGVPTMYHALLGALGEVDAPEVFAETLQFAISGGAAMPVALLRQITERLGVRVLEGYGLSETSPAACFSPLAGPNRPGSIGKPIWGVQMKLIDADWTEIADDPEAIGEIAIKGHPIMKGYYNRLEATAEVLRDGWFRTGDLARRDADGYYFIVDRAKEVIIRGGYNVYPREIEEVLMTHPAVSLVAVIGVAHASLGEEVKAVVLKTLGDSTSEEELIAWGKEQFAAYKYPRIVEFRTVLPMTSTGKIKKMELSR